MPVRTERGFSAFYAVKGFEVWSGCHNLFPLKAANSKQGHHRFGIRAANNCEPGIDNVYGPLSQILQTIVELCGRMVAVRPTRARAERGNEWISGEGRPFPLIFFWRTKLPVEESLEGN